jgi:hypothetical protein
MDECGKVESCEMDSACPYYVSCIMVEDNVTDQCDEPGCDCADYVDD